MAFLTVYIPADVKAWLAAHRQTVNKSGVVTAAFRALMRPFARSC